MFMLLQPFTPAVKAHLDAQLSLLNDLSEKLFHTVQQIGELHLQVAQTLLAESLANTQQALEAKDPYDALLIVAGQAQPAAERVRAFSQRLTQIAAGTQVELVKTAEDHAPETTRTAAALADEVARTASEETEKTTQRQRRAMEKLTNPIPVDGSRPSPHKGA